MSTVEEIIQVNRLPQGWQLLPLCVYFPIGILLFTIRIFVSLNALVAAYLLPRVSLVRNCVLRTMCFILGIMVYEEDIAQKNSSAKLLVTNHVSVFDQLIFDLIFPFAMPSISDLPQLVNWCLGYKDFAANNGRNTLIQNITKYLREPNNNCSVVFHPEGAITNGSVGLLKFNSWPFSLGRVVHPVLVTTSRPFPFVIATSVVASQWWSDVFWLFFCPITFFNVRYLSEMEKDDDEDESQFANRVQQSMASEIKLKATSISAADINEFVKRLNQQQRSHQPQPIAHDQIQASSSEELIQMCQQVKEVVPHVPIDVIRSDLLITRNVDLTITNILEGVVQFVPEVQYDLPSISERELITVNSISRSSTGFSDKSTATAASDFSTAASSFGKTAEERMQSFQERKQQLLDHARKQFLDKHKRNNSSSTRMSSQVDTEDSIESN